jgi:hypothetical protein
MPHPDVPTLDFTWPEFKEYCFERQFYEGAYYRGQSNSEWGLTPSYFRFAEDPDIDKYMSHILPSVARKISGYSNNSYNPDQEESRNHLLGLLQHHGFPTPLLYWTRSPYIAAFFALFDHAFSEPDCDYVSIWVLNGDFVHEYIESEEGECPYYEVLKPDARFNKRLLRQDGLFTLSKTEEDLDIPLAAAMDRLEHPGLLQNWRIPVRFSRLALNDLHLMGLHPGTLFPGIDGVCKSLMINYFVPSESSPGKSDREFIKSIIERVESKKGA